MEKDIVKIRKLRGENEVEMQDTIAVEKRFCVCIEDGKEYGMSCTPSHLEELVLGQLFAGGVLKSAEEVVSLDVVEEKGLIEVKIFPKNSDRYTAEKKAGPSAFAVPKTLIFQTVTELFENPSVFFTETGCVHSCSLMIDGKIMCTMEDIARHNALDKVIGYGLKNKLPLENAVIFASGRISGDYIKKAVRAGVRMVVSRAAVTGEAVEIAKREQVTLLGFVRHNSGNVYHEGEILLR